MPQPLSFRLVAAAILLFLPKTALYWRGVWLLGFARGALMLLFELVAVVALEDVSV